MEEIVEKSERIIKREKGRLERIGIGEINKIVDDRIMKVEKIVDRLKRDNKWEREIRGEGEIIEEEKEELDEIGIEKMKKKKIRVKCRDEIILIKEDEEKEEWKVERGLDNIV